MTRTLDEVDPETRALLERFGFAAIPFDELRDRVAAGTLGPATNVLHGSIEPPRPEDVLVLPTAGEARRAEARDTGLDAIRRGELAHLVLAGGMATRFGGVVKAAVEVLPGRSFLDLALAETARIAEGVDATVPTAVMTSFATDDTVRTHLAGLPLPTPLVFSQLVALRLRPDGALFRDAAGAASPYGPGHGDLFDALRTSGTLATLLDRGVKHVLVANVDNLGATVDPVVLGMHLLEDRPLTVEVARKDGDTGGAPARVDGRLRLVEGPCFPPGFDQDAIPVFNTNTALIRLDALAGPVQLTWLAVAKRVDDVEAIQLERLYHELSALVPTTYLEVPRGGPGGRFLPVKEPADLDGVRKELVDRPIAG